MLVMACGGTDVVIAQKSMVSIAAAEGPYLKDHQSAS